MIPRLVHQVSFQILFNHMSRRLDTESIVKQPKEYKVGFGGYDLLIWGIIPMFRSNISSPSSRSKNKLSMKPEETVGKLRPILSSPVSPKRWALSEPQGLTARTTVMFPEDKMSDEHLDVSYPVDCKGF
jgi:hypothetical protein